MIKLLYYLRINAAFIFALLFALPFFFSNVERGPASAAELSPTESLEHRID